MDATPCPACGHVNAVAAEACANCGEPLPAADIPVHPGETFRDPDDLSFPDPASPPERKQKLEAVNVAQENLGAVNVARGTSGFTAIPSDDESEAEALRRVAERISRRRELRDAIVGPEFGPAVRPRHYAGFVIRLLAFAIDLFVLFVFTVPLAVAVVVGVKAGLFFSGTRVLFVDTEEAITELVAIAWLAMAALYFVLLHRRTGQTIGKAVVGIAVRSARDLAGIGVIRSAVRMLGYALSASFLFAGFLTIIFSPRKRGWHDYLAGTCVVHLAPEEV